jgi:hypothetical protein
MGRGREVWHDVRVAGPSLSSVSSSHEVEVRRVGRKTDERNSSKEIPSRVH